MKIHLTFYELLNVYKTMPNGIEKSIEYYMIKHTFYEQKPFFVVFFGFCIVRMEFQLFKRALTRRAVIRSVQMRFFVHAP